MSKNKRQLETKIAERKIIKEKLFLELLEKSRKNSLIRKNQEIDEWKMFIVSHKGTISIRCQCKVINKKPYQQCLKKAIAGRLFCTTHGGLALVKSEKTKEIKKDLGIYTGEDIKSLRTELSEIENISEEQLQDTTDELKLGIALLRKYLKNTDDDKIAKGPGQLMWLIGEIARLKKEHYEIKHSKNVSWTKEQVQFLFNQFYLILIKQISDHNLLKSISEEIDRVGKQIGQTGFKVL